MKFIYFHLSENHLEVNLLVYCSYKKVTILVKVDITLQVTCYVCICSIVPKALPEITLQNGICV